MIILFIFQILFLIIFPYIKIICIVIIMDKDTEYEIINNIDLFDFIYKFDSNNEINSNKYNISSHKKNGDDHDSFISYFDMEGYIENIKKSYSCREDKIYYQFGIDYNRQNIKLNGYKYDKNTFIKTLDKLLENVFNKKLFELSWKTLIILLCCQSSFFLPYRILSQKYISNNIPHVITSGGCDSININISIDKNKVIVELNNSFCIKNTELNTCTHKINSTITIDLDKNIKNDLFNPLICIFYWKIQNIIP